MASSGCYLEAVVVVGGQGLVHDRFLARQVEPHLSGLVVPANCKRERVWVKRLVLVGV